MTRDNFQKQSAPVAAGTLLTAIVDSSENAIVSKDINGMITSWNAAAERIFGYKAEEVVGGPISVIIPPDKGEEERDILQHVRRGEAILNLETQRLTKQGRRIDLSVRITPIFEQGRVIGALKFARDITREKEMLREAEQQRARLEVTLRSIGDAVIVTDNNGAVTFMNPVAEALTGWNLSEARGEPLESVFRIVSEGTRRRVENPAARSLREGVVVGLANHTVLISRAGAEYAIDDSAAPIRNGTQEVFGCVLVFRDVSGSRAAEEYRARLAAIVQSSDDAIIGKDLTGKITSWNEGAARLFGYVAEEAIGRSISMLIPPDRLDEETNILRELRLGQRIDHFETVRLSKDRRKIEVSITISPIRNAEGEVIGASKIARDITDRKRAERELQEAREQLQKYSEELEKKVAERTTELREALAQLEAFSYSISHDLRAPLRAINAFADMLLQEHTNELRPEGRDLLDRMMRSARRLSMLVEDVLSNAQLKITNEHLRPVPLATLLPALIEDYPNLREHRDAIKIEQPLLPVLASEPLLTQCVSNLLGNAIKYVPESRPPTIKIWTERKDGRVRLCIRDNGVGIPVEDQARIFEPFSRGSSADAVEGFGVGLAVVKRAVGRMGGQIKVSSEPGAGSEFCIELPAADGGREGR